VSPASIVFTAANWNTPQTVTVTGVDDSVADGSRTFVVVTAAAISGDAGYNGLDPSGVSGHPTWGALDLDEVMSWSQDAVLCVVIAIALFVPAAVLALDTPPLGAALAGVLLPAATEEFAYRGVLLMALVRLLPACKVRAAGRVALALVLGSVAFAAAHASLLTPERPLAVACQRGVAGLVLGFVALRSRSLLAPMFAHAAFNAVVLTPGFGR